jgi:NAD(P)-dependent dehydrogenase (short-subunit alcohol dehydrogenase family)
MARVFVSGSSTGLGLLAGKELLAKGHDVVFHARTAARAEDVRREVAGTSSIVVGDISTVSGALDFADQVNALGPVDAVIHNAGVPGGSLRPTADGIPDVFAVNVLAPYILTARISGPKRLIYLSSSMHRVSPSLDDVLWRTRRWNGTLAYSESKFFVTALAFAVARLRPEVRANAVDPGWVPTRMGGRGAPDDLGEGCATQVALATSSESRVAGLTGEYLYHMAARQPDQNTRVTSIQDQLLDICQRLSGVSL